MKTVYQLRMGLFSDGHNVFDKAPEGPKVLGLAQAPKGHPAHQHNARLPKSQNVKKRPYLYDLSILKQQAMGVA